MMAALLTNLDSNLPDLGLPPDALKKWKRRQKRLFERAKETLDRQRADSANRRKHIEDAYHRLRAIPEAKVKLEAVITNEAPDFRVIERNEAIVLLINQLYIEFLEEEDILLLAASLI